MMIYCVFEGGIESNPRYEVAGILTFSITKDPEGTIRAMADGKELAIYSSASGWVISGVGAFKVLRTEIK